MSLDNVLTFVHISDIHFARTSGDPYDIDDELRQAMLNDLNSKAKQQFTKVNGVLVCGDLAFSGKAEEYKIACDFLNEILQIFNLEKNDIYCVAGNHDVDQSVAKESLAIELVQRRLALEKKAIKLDGLIRKIQNDPIIEMEGGLLYRQIEEYNKCVTPMACNYTTNLPNWSTTMPLNDKYELVIYGMNSVITSNYKDHLDDNGNKYADGKERKMSINRGQIPKLRDNSVYLSLCHHPPECWNDESLAALMDSRVKVQLYGHKHIQSIDANEQRVRICSGALHPERGGDWYPKYNWIQVWVENEELFVKIYPRIYNDTDGVFHEDASSCIENDIYQEYRITLSNRVEIPEEEIVHGEEIRRTTVTTKEIVYLFSVLSDRDKVNLLKQFPVIDYDVTQEIDVLLMQINIHDLQEDFLEKLKNKRD